MFSTVGASWRRRRPDEELAALPPEDFLKLRSSFVASFWLLISPNFPGLSRRLFNQIREWKKKTQICLFGCCSCPAFAGGHISNTSVTPLVQRGSTRQKSADLASAAALFLANLMCSQRDVHASEADRGHHQYLLRQVAPAKVVYVIKSLACLLCCRSCFMQSFFFCAS